MEKSCHSSGDSASNGRQNPGDQYLKHLNKISHKISKPPIRRNPLDHQSHHQHQHQHQHEPPPLPPPQIQQQQQQQQQQPPVYNINKSDFRDVVQKLTGSPAHDRFSTPPPIQPPKPPSSRLQRIRPPPLAHLAHVSNRPLPPLNNAIVPLPSSSAVSSSTNPNNFIINSNNNGRKISPLSPLPPFPAVHAAAESPVSAYMKYLQSSTPTNLESESNRLSGLSPRWNNFSSFQQQSQQFLVPSPTSAMPPSSPFFMPNSPLAFGRIASPRSPYPLLSPSLLFSPTTGQLGFPQFPPSPRLPVPSPRWRGL